MHPDSLSNWMMIGSGPSAARWPVPKNPDGTRFRVGTANDSQRLVDRPDVLGIYEINAALKLRPSSRPGTVLCTRPGIARQFDLVGQPGVKQIGMDWGPDGLRDLHQDVEWGVHSVPDYGQNRAWISAGVLTLWVIAESFRPRVILVSGLDGYPSTKDSDRNYARGLTDLSAAGMDSDPSAALVRREQMNARMGLGVARITRHYFHRYGTRFIWVEKPVHWQPDWAVEVLDPQVEDFGKQVAGLYPGFVQD